MVVSRGRQKVKVSLLKVGPKVVYSFLVEAKRLPKVRWYIRPKMKAKRKVNHTQTKSGKVRELLISQYR